MFIGHFFVVMTRIINVCELEKKKKKIVIFFMVWKVEIKLLKIDEKKKNQQTQQQQLVSESFFVCTGRCIVKCTKTFSLLCGTVYTSKRHLIINNNKTWLITTK